MDAGGQDRKKERKGESEQLSDYRLLLGMTHTINLTTQNVGCYCNYRPRETINDDKKNHFQLDLSHRSETLLDNKDVNDTFNGQKVLISSNYSPFWDTDFAL